MPVCVCADASIEAAFVGSRLHPHLQQVCLALLLDVYNIRLVSRNKPSENAFQWQGPFGRCCHFKYLKSDVHAETQSSITWHTKQSHCLWILHLLHWGHTPAVKVPLAQPAALYAMCVIAM